MAHATAAMNSSTPRRRRSNAIMMTLVARRHAVRPRLAGADPGRAAVEGFSGLSLAVFTEMTPPPGSAGGLLNPIIGSLILTVLAVAIGTPIGILAGTYMAEYGRHDRLTIGRALHQRHPAQRAVDRDRPVHLRGHGRADGPLLRLGRRRGAGRHRHSGGRAHHRGHADAGAGHVARGGRLDRPAALAHDHPRRLSRRQGRHDDRRAAGDRPHQRRDRAAAVHRAQQPVLEHQPQRADGEPAGRDLPVRAQPLQGLAGAGLDRRADHHLRRARAQHRRARALPRRENSHERRLRLGHRRRPSPTRRSDTPASTRRSRSATSISTTATQGAEGHHLPLYAEQGDRLHRPVRLRQVDAAARPQPDVRPLSRTSAPRAR